MPLTFNERPPSYTLNRALALCHATTVISKHFSARQIRSSLSTQNEANVAKFQNAPIGVPFLVYSFKKIR